jgi:hypothetical protein
MTGEGRPIKWFLRPAAVIVALLIAGPFALPLVWLSPGFKLWQKAALTAITLVLTAMLVESSVELYKTLVIRLKEIQATC